MFYVNEVEYNPANLQLKPTIVPFKEEHGGFRPVKKQQRIESGLMS
jgi:hypothetical protein